MVKEEEDEGVEEGEDNEGEGETVLICEEHAWNSEGGDQEKRPKEKSPHRAAPSQKVGKDSPTPTTPTRCSKSIAISSKDAPPVVHQAVGSDSDKEEEPQSAAPPPNAQLTSLPTKVDQLQKDNMNIMAAFQDLCENLSQVQLDQDICFKAITDRLADVIQEEVVHEAVVPDDPNRDGPPSLNLPHLFSVLLISYPYHRTI